MHVFIHIQMEKMPITASAISHLFAISSILSRCQHNGIKTMYVFLMYMHRFLALTRIYLNLSIYLSIYLYDLLDFFFFFRGDSNLGT